MPSPLILAIDTCLGACQAAIGRDAGFELASEALARGHQERLGPMVRDLMAGAGAAFADIHLIAVTVGPGSFTGLRVGIAFAKGLGLALGRPCVGVGTLEAMAGGEPARPALAAVIDAGRGRVFFQGFRGAKAATPPELLDLDAARSRLETIFGSDEFVLTGPGGALLADRCPHAHLVARAVPDIAAVARLGADADRAPVAPLYLRPADATPKVGRVSA